MEIFSLMKKRKRKGRKERKEVASEMFQCICPTGNAECPGNDFTCNKGKEVQSVCFTFQKVILENDKRWAKIYFKIYIQSNGSISILQW